MPSGCLALTNVFLVFSFLSLYFKYDFLIKKITRTKIVPSKRQLPKPINLLEGIANGGNGALIWSTAIL